tara:strand:+ start:3768 stop:4643 length:876 start_codon:yes stop_codon:yes gene_type:complete
MAFFLMIFTNMAHAGDLKVDAFSGQIHRNGNPDLSLDKYSIHLKWACYKHKIFSTEAWQSCGSEFSGNKVVAINKDGTFKVPTIHQDGPFLSSSAVFTLDASLIDEKGEYLQSLGRYGGKGYYVDSVYRPVDAMQSDLQTLGLIKIVGGAFPFEIDLSQTDLQGSFDDLRQNYPSFYLYDNKFTYILSYAKEAGGIRNIPYHTSYDLKIEMNYAQGSLSTPSKIWLVKGLNSNEQIEVGIQADLLFFITKDSQQQNYRAKLNKSVNTNVGSSVSVAAILAQVNQILVERTK